MRAIIFTLVFLLGALAAGLASRPPLPRSVHAPQRVFSAARALGDVRAIAARPHPSGSADIARVRSHLTTRFSALGLETSVHSGEGIDDRSRWAEGVAAARVLNIAAILHGRDGTLPVVLVMSHYDTVPNSPGAADDTAGVAAALEVARALKAGPPPLRDVIFLATDAEEAGLLGARAFFADDPLRRRVGTVLNLEARGDSGRAAMFETGPDGGGLIDLYRHATGDPAANSMTAAVYALMPNGTDFTPALQAGARGFNLAFIGDELAYHTPLATPRHLNAGSLQHIGDQALALTRALAANAAPPKSAPTPVYFDLLGRVLIAYPAWTGWLVVGAGGVLALGAALTAHRRGLASWGEMARGAGVLPLIGLADALVLHLAGEMLGARMDGARTYALLAHYDRFLAGAVLLGIGVSLSLLGALRTGRYRAPVAAGATALGLACSLGHGLDVEGLGLGLACATVALGALGRPTRGWGGWIGGLLCATVVAAALQAIFPAGAFMLAWPLLLGALGAAVTLALGETRLGSPRSLWITAIIGVFALAQTGAWAQALFSAVGVSAPEVLALAALICTPTLLPLAEGAAATEPDRIASLGLVAAGMALLTLTGLAGPGRARPRVTQALYVADFRAAALSYARIAPQPVLDAWSRAALAAGGGVSRAALDPWFAAPVWRAPAPAATSLSPPAIVLARGSHGVSLTVSPANRGRRLDLLVRTDFPVGTATLDGRPVRLSAQPGHWRGVTLSAPPPGGLTLDLPAPLHGRVEVQTREVVDGWPQGLAPARPPASLMGWGDSDTTEVLGAAKAAW